MRKQSLAILSIIAVGTLFSVGYAASTIITDTSISTTNLTVTGTCTGCGVSEGSFSHYNTIFLNTTLTGTSDTQFGGILIDNNGNVVYSGSNDNVYVNSTGNVQFINGSYNVIPTQISQSIAGNYVIVVDDSVNYNVSVFKNGKYLQNLELNTSQFVAPTSNERIAISISPNAHYISVVGVDPISGFDRLVIFRGT